MGSFPNTLENDAIISLGDEAESGRRVLSEQTDAQLVGLVLAGDETAFEQIFDRHKRSVAAVAGRYFRQPSEIEEMIQVTFVKAFIEMAKFRGEHEFSLAGWLRTIAVHSCIDLLRKKKHRSESLDCELTDPGPAAFARVASGGSSSEKAVSDRDLAEKLLKQLEAEDRVLLQLLYAEELSVAEISGILDWSVSKVKIRAWRARRKLRKLLVRYL